MTAASVSTPKANNRSGLWTFLRLAGGWATVAALAYLLWVPNKDWGWVTLLFGWALLTILADEFAGWFGYMALVLGVLPLLNHTPPQWLVIFPLVGGALFALLIIKHSGGLFVLPFSAAIFAGAIIGAGKLGAKVDPSLTFVSNHTFQRTALMAMAIGVGFSFLRQLATMIWRWVKARQQRPRAISKPVQPVPIAGANAKVADATVTTPPVVAAPVASPATPIVSAPPKTPKAATPTTSNTAVIVIAANPQPLKGDAGVNSVEAVTTAGAKTAPSRDTVKNPTAIDLDLSHLGERTPEED